MKSKKKNSFTYLKFNKFLLILFFGLFSNAKIFSSEKRGFPKRFKKELESIWDYQASIMAHLPPNFALTGVEIGTLLYAKEDLKDLPILQDLQDELTLDRVWNEAEKSKQVTKDNKVLGVNVLTCIGLERVWRYCHQAEQQIKNLADLAAEKEKINLNLGFLKNQKELEELRKQNNDLLILNQAKIHQQKIKYYTKLFSVSLGLLAALMFVASFIYGWILPLFKFISVSKTPQIINFTNDKSPFISSKGDLSRNKLDKAFYNEKEREYLFEELKIVLNWASKSSFFGKNLILYGPSGTGKSLFLKILALKASKKGAVYYFINGARLSQLKKEKGSGEVKKEILSILKRAEKKEKVLILIDEVDLIDSTDIKSIQGEIESSMSKRVLLIFTTNQIKNIPEAVLDRMDKIRIDLPSQLVLKKILVYLLLQAKKKGVSIPSLRKTEGKQSDLDILISVFSKKKASARKVSDAIKSAIQRALLTKTKELLIDDIRKQFELSLLNKGEGLESDQAETSKKITRTRL